MQRLHMQGRDFPKGKQRARDVDSGLGSGGANGILLPLEYVATSAYDAAYSLPLLVGSGPQNISVQVDTGSSDLWIASTSCSDQVCSYPGQDKLYNPTSSTDARDTSVEFNITYLAGQVVGEVYWDRVEVGGYAISSQALAAATSVANEPLGPSFSGVLGLALPDNSVIASYIQPTFGNTPDGAAWASNLFSITKGSDSTDTEVAPSEKFLSLTLSRPGSDNVPSLLGIGMHPPVGVVTLPDSLGGSSAQLGFDKVNYHPPLGSDSTQGPLFWKVAVMGISVWVDSQEKQIQMAKTPGIVDDDSSLTAVLDSGVPLIITSSAIANGIYGALGIGPAADGNYYLPCTTPLNITFNILTYASSPSSTTTSTTSSALPPTQTTLTPITIPYSVHPLDLSDPSPSGSCTSLIKADDAGLESARAADMILGVPFLRGVYTVMAYQQPAANGSFPVLATTSDIVPLLGLQTLLDPANSLDEFHRVRVLNQPIDPSDTCSGNSCSDDGSKKKLSVGIDVLIGLGGVIAFFCIAGVLFWIISTRRARRRDQERGEFAGVPTNDLAGVPTSDLTGETKPAGALAFLIPAWLHKSDKSSFGKYKVAGLHERSDSSATDLSEDELRRIRSESYLDRSASGNAMPEGPIHPPALFLSNKEDETTMSSGRTRVGGSLSRKGDDKEDADITEFGWKETHIEDLLTGGTASETVADLPPPPVPEKSDPQVSPDDKSVPAVAAAPEEETATSPLEYISTPSSVSPHPRSFLPDGFSPTSPSHRPFSTSQLPSPSVREFPEIRPRIVSDYEPVTDFGEISGGMAGIGTAARSKRGFDGGLEFFRTDENGISLGSPPQAVLRPPS